MKNTRKAGFTALALVVGGLLVTAGLAGPARAADKPFGGPDSVGYAKALWTALERAHLVGKDTIRTKPYVGKEPHGAVLENVATTVTVNGHTGLVYVKKNYVGKGLTVEQVAEEFDEYLDSVTVMFRRERGYDRDNKDWFWVKFNPDGSVQKNPKGMSLAGRVAKGAPQGCIACHTAAPGKDMVFTNNRHANY